MVQPLGEVGAGVNVAVKFGPSGLLGFWVHRDRDPVSDGVAGKRGVCFEVPECLCQCGLHTFIEIVALHPGGFNS